MNKTIGVIGAGKLGEILLAKLSNIKSFGTRTNHPDYRRFDINTDSMTELPEAEVFVICIPPSRYEFESVKLFIESASDKKIIFISSTSVYGTNTGMVDENSERTPITESAKKLVQIEDLVLKTNQGVVIRPSGLYSKDSHPGRFLSGKTNIKNPHAPVNLISREHVANVIIELFDREDIRSINLANINHPSKKEYYTDYCKRLSLELPIFEASKGTHQKTIKSIYKELSSNVSLP
jgi:hypothetical protein